MTLKLEKFYIEGLYNSTTLNISITDNILILVGENGAGKTTIANLIFSVLAQLWDEIVSHSFDNIKITLEGKEIEIPRNEISTEMSRDNKNRALSRIPRIVKTQLDDIISKYTLEDILSRNTIAQISEDYRIPLVVLTDYLRISQKMDLDFHFETAKASLSEMVDDDIEILYLPTYRRIEKDIREIFPNLDENFLVERLSYSRNYRQRNNKSYIELVEFGMNDVKADIDKQLEDLSRKLNEEWTNLASTYLLDVIREKYRNIDVTRLSNLSEDIIDSILSRVSDNTLWLNSDKKSLRRIIEDVKKTGKIQNSDEVVAHFLLRLVDLHEKQQAQEQSIKNFVEICNRYLVNKKIEYDSTTFEVRIEQNSHSNSKVNISMKMLSSGEKQIISLFAHLYFSKKSKFFVIIDEPELSLSLEWQKQFLPDILATGRCVGLIAVTHSPFIFDNELARYAHDISEFWG